MDIWVSEVSMPWYCCMLKSCTYIKECHCSICTFSIIHYSYLFLCIIAKKESDGRTTHAPHCAVLCCAVLCCAVLCCGHVQWTCAVDMCNSSIHCLVSSIYVPVFVCVLIHTQKAFLKATTSQKIIVSLPRKRSILL